MRALAAEFLGTFALVFFGCGAIANGLPPTSVALAFGLVIAVMVYALGHISGAHFNPAVSVAFAVGRHAPWPRTAAYVGAQLLGATVGALVLRATLGPDADLGVTRPAGSDIQSFVWEAVLTFFLMLLGIGGLLTLLVGLWDAFVRWWNRLGSRMRLLHPGPHRRALLAAARR